MICIFLHWKDSCVIQDWEQHVYGRFSIPDYLVSLTVPLELQGHKIVVFNSSFALVEAEIDSPEPIPSQPGSPQSPAWSPRNLEGWSPPAPGSPPSLRSRSASVPASQHQRSSGPPSSPGAEVRQIFFQ